MRRFMPLLLALPLLVGCKRRDEGGPTKIIRAPGTENVQAPPPVPTEAPAAARDDWPPPPPPPAVRATPDAGAAANTLNGNPKGPKAEDLSGVVQAAASQLQGCLDGNADLPVGTINVSINYQVEPSGAASGINVSAPGAPASVVDCLKGRFESLRFPPFEGAAVTGGYPMVYTRMAQPMPPPPR